MPVLTKASLSEIQDGWWTETMSENPTFDLMALPREIRDRVYVYIITNGGIKIEYKILPAYRWEINLKSRKTLIAPEYGSLQKVVHNSTPSSEGSWSHLRRRSRSKGLPSCFNILFSSRQVSDEAIQVLYGCQPFHIPYEQSEAFRLKFIPLIGALNTSYIKRINLTFPECLKQNTTLMTPYYIELFHQMPKLKELVIGTHFYAHSSNSRIPSEYSSIILFAAQVAISLPRLTSATFLDMGLQEAVQMRHNPALTRSVILSAQIDIKIRLSARTTQEELAVLLKNGGLMLDAQKVAAAGEKGVFKCWEPKNWALDLGEAISVLTTAPKADETPSATTYTSTPVPTGALSPQTPNKLKRKAER